MDKAVVDTSAVPPVATVYHCKELPVATKLETVAELLNVCDDAVGAAVVFIVTATAVRALSQEFTVCVT